MVDSLQQDAAGREHGEQTERPHEQAVEHEGDPDPLLGDLVAHHSVFAPLRDRLQARGDVIERGADTTTAVEPVVRVFVDVEDVLPQIRDVEFEWRPVTASLDGLGGVAVARGVLEVDAWNLKYEKR